MEEGKNRMQIKPDFGKDAGVWRKGRTGCRSGRILKEYRRMEEGKNRMQIRLDFGKDAGA